MKKLYEILGQHVVKGDIGIEIEVEGHHLKQVEDKRWKTANDGSLRGESFEYILAAPLPVTKVRDALTSIRKELDDYGSKLEFSFRTSVHVHVNCQELTFPQYLSMIYTYLLLEEPLITFCGRERKGNRFCLRLQDAEGLLDTLSYMFRNGEMTLHEINVDAIRYAAMNIGATKNYGSLEFRGMRGNLDVDNLMTWVTSLYRIRKFAMEMGTPNAVYDAFVQGTPQEFLRTVVGGLAVKYNYPRIERDIQRSFSLSLDLPYSFKEVKEEVALEVPKIKVPDGGFENMDEYRRILNELMVRHPAPPRAARAMRDLPPWAAPMAPVEHDRMIMDEIEDEQEEEEEE